MTLPLLSLLSALAIMALAGCGEKKITKADIDRIHTGMKASQVKSILGEAQSSMTSEVSGSPDRKETIRVYGEGDGSVVVRYDGNDQVVSVGGEASSHISTADEKGNAFAPEKPAEKKPNAEPANALEQLRQAAEAGNADAQYQLGMSYWQKTAGMSMGDAGNSQYARDAEPWFRKAAEQGHAAAQFKIGDMYWRAWGDCL